MYRDGSGWGWMMIVMPLLWIALTTVVVWGVLKVAKRPAGQVTESPRRETPQEILDRRFASGEIDTDTYAQATIHLTNHGAHSH